MKTKLGAHWQALDACGENIEARQKLVDSVFKNKPDNWADNDNWCEGAYEKYLRKEEKIINFLESKLVGGKSGNL